MAKKKNPLLGDADNHRRKNEVHWLAKLRTIDSELAWSVDDLIQGYIDGRSEYTQKFESQAHVARVIQARLPDSCKVSVGQIQNYISERRSGNAI